MRANSSRDGTTSSGDQWLRLPTSMYSMNRTITPVPRKRSTRSSTVWSLTPRCTTALILMGSRPARRACSIPESTSSGATEPAAHAAEDLRVGAVEADGNALQARRAQLEGVLGEQDTIGGQGDVVDAVDGRQVANEIRKSRPQQRLATGEAQLAHPEPHEQPRYPDDLIERQALMRAQESVAVMEGAPAACSTGSGNCTGP